MKYLMLGLLVALAACATTEQYGENTKTYIGKNADELIKDFGTPTSESTLSTGEKIVTFHMSEGVRHARVSGSYISREKYCDTRFTVNSSNIVTAFKYDGNNCKAYDKN